MRHCGCLHPIREKIKGRIMSIAGKNTKMTTPLEIMNKWCSRNHVSLHVGEMSAKEWRTVRVILHAIRREIAATDHEFIRNLQEEIAWARDTAALSPDSAVKPKKVAMSARILNTLLNRGK